MSASVSLLPYAISVVAEIPATQDPGFDSDNVTPGVVGFVATAFIAVMAILLAIDMARRVRRVRYRAEIDAMLDAESSADPGAPSARKAATGGGSAQENAVGSSDNTGTSDTANGRNPRDEA
ncbi:hypothetical protein [Lysinibacter sp. HNR]|uniref:hypothetical protein n=1 Tax=Lysinibacter sp. HNR TaxID=3031408 RepID=UPI002435B736|nr:hypothetical protein [Lysinibacter sp. HNR]WGD36848.1 hypothetical protein FrondiHNR_10380 [Lysinibacter sp. HNR]